MAENSASALLAQWQELSRPSVLAILPILGFVALLGGRRRTGLAAVPALVNTSHPSPALLANPFLWQLISSWPVSGLLALILPLAALALWRMDPRLPVAVSVYLSPLVASALGVAIAWGGSPIVVMAVAPHWFSGTPSTQPPKTG